MDHNLWNLYDLKQFVKKHPGEPYLVQRYAGGEALTESSRGMLKGEVCSLKVVVLVIPVGPPLPFVIFMTMFSLNTSGDISSESTEAPDPSKCAFQV